MRSKRGAPAAGAVALALLAAAGCGTAPERFGAARHVVWISLDTTRADHMGFYGNRWIATPRLDALARDAVVLDDLMTVVPTTLASHTSLMTGRYPHHHGVPRNGFVVPPQNVTLAEVLHDAGFRTEAFVGSFALARRFGLDQGFDLYDQRFDQRAGERGADQDQRNAAAVTGAVLARLEREPIPRHLFLFVHYFDPHAPYAPPPPYDKRYDPAGLSVPIDMPAIVELCRRRPGEPNGLAERAARLYAAEITFMDEQIGRLLDGLRERGILDDAYLIVTSDHGENFWEHPGFFGHGLTVYQTLIHAVGLIRPPGGVPGGRRLAAPLQTIDLFPALLSWLGIPAPEDIEGRPFSLEGNAGVPPERPRFAEATKPWKKVETDPRWRNARKSRCIVRGRYKLIVTPYRGTEELYDLAADPAERHDLIAAGEAPAGVLRALRKALAEWDAAAAPLPSRFEPARTEETRRRLRSLGYLGGP